MIERNNEFIRIGNVILRREKISEMYFDDRKQIVIVEAVGIYGKPKEYEIKLTWREFERLV